LVSAVNNTTVMLYASRMPAALDRAAWALAVALVGGAAHAAAQDASVAGTVSDERGNRLSGVTIVLEAGGRSFTATTGARGEFSLSVAAGRYSLQAALPGFAVLRRDVEAGAPGSGALELRLRRGLLSLLPKPELRPRAIAAPALLAAGPSAIVPVYFATDRKPTGLELPKPAFGNERDAAARELHFGVCPVSVPRRHNLAVLQLPEWMHFELAGDPTRDLVLTRVVRLERADFHRALESRKGDVLLFVHGFNVSFADALRRTAQLAYDLEWRGPALTFTWASGDGPTLTSYAGAEATVDWSKYNLARLLGQLEAGLGEGRRIQVIAHSLGNRLLARALDLRQRERERARIFHHVALTAPDVDVGEFAQLAPAVRDAGADVTLYVSTDDKPLLASKKLHGGYERLGLRDGARADPYPGFQTVDATGIEMSFLNHSYYGDSAAVVRDLLQLLRCDLPAAQRFGLQPVPSRSAPRYWRFVRARLAAAPCKP
jgi:esterase/lipase superfamily enzyme